MKAPLNIGDRVPNFALSDQNGKVFNLEEELIDKKLVLFFYPKDDSLVCTQQACAFRDAYSELAVYGARVIGINSGTVESHQNFSQNQRLGMTLLSDPHSVVLNLFGVKNWLFLTGRETFILDQTGIILFKYRNLFSGKSHLKKVLKFLQSNAQTQ
ncbi:peroxiredoxin [Flavobacterium sp. HSC-61S13]|uniref:peroxiredoxin n=1 Tax=Flavobacterium sp. HSC-61S13 TaxID=2910963 RepID=UPI00209F0E7F|nr:peroxiredoxin [Flavobacterium sp. HSC-61S13]MCP1994675.1 peroxiredoxin Q/BCP [Flavobacterium sp. HSC-61S13]